MRNQLAISRHHRGVELGSIKKHIELVIKMIMVDELRDSWKYCCGGSAEKKSARRTRNLGFKLHSNDQLNIVLGSLKLSFVAMLVNG